MCVCVCVHVCTHSFFPTLAGHSDSVAVARGLRSTQASVIAALGLCCSEACGIFLPTRDPTRVLCIARQILYPWATREVLLRLF